MQQKLPKRDEVAKELTWRLEDIYDDESKWESELNKVNELADKFASYQGKISKDSKSLLEVSKLAEEVELYLDRVYGYAHKALQREFLLEGW